MTTESPSLVVQPRRTNRRTIILLLIVAVVLVVLYTQVGFYTVQPIGTIPNGVTLLIWRHSDEPFFNSPDGTCLRLMNGVSLLCRAQAMQLAPADRIILRLGYWDFAYLQSTNGARFDR
jgi:hypothetical protein